MEVPVQDVGNHFHDDFQCLRLRINHDVATSTQVDLHHSGRLSSVLQDNDFMFQHSLTLIWLPTLRKTLLLRSNKGSFGPSPRDCADVFLPVPPVLSQTGPVWRETPVSSLSLETSGQCGQSTYFILCIRFPHRKKKSECVTQANKSFSYSVKVAILYSLASLKALNYIIMCQIDDPDKKPIKITLV